LGEAQEKQIVKLAKRHGARTFRFKTLKNPEDREWLRDRWTQVGQGIFVPPADITSGWVRADPSRGLTSRRIVQSPLGTGGRVVSGRDFILVQRDPDYGAVKPHADWLEKSGWKVYVMPSPSRKAQREDVIKHIDLHVGVAPTKNGGHLILANRKYLAENRALFDRIARETGSKIVQVPEKEEALFPTNFLVLPDGKVLMTGGAPKTKALMEKAGIQVYTTIPLKETVTLGGGLRCLTNTFYPKEKKRPISEVFSRK